MAIYPSQKTLRISPSQKVEYPSEQRTPSQNQALVQEEGVNLNIKITDNLKSISQPPESMMTHLTSQGEMPSLLAMADLYAGSSNKPKDHHIFDQKNGIVHLLYQIRDILQEEGNSFELTTSKSINAQQFINTKNYTINNKINNQNLIKGIDGWLITQQNVVNESAAPMVTPKNIDKQQDTSSVLPMPIPTSLAEDKVSNRNDNTRKQDNPKLDLHNLALFLETVDDMPKEKGTVQTTSAHRTFLEWVQWLYLSLLPSAADRRKDLQKNRKDKSSQKRDLFADDDREIE